MAAQVDVRTFRLLAKAQLWGALLVTVAGVYAATKAQWGLMFLCLGAGAVALYFVQRLAIRVEVGSEDVLVFVTKDGCSLCEEARNLLPAITADTPFRVEEVRIEADRFLRRHFKNEVPVLLWQSEVVARLGWDVATVRGRLQHIVENRRPAPGRQSP